MMSLSHPVRDGIPPKCLPPRDVQAPKTFIVPAGAWDVHAHVIDGSDRIPFINDRSYTPSSASPAEYIAMLDAVGITYGVVIQISVHGADNRLIVEALQQYPARLRGVVSLGGSETEEELIALRDAGVCGVRLNEHFAGGAKAEALEELADRCRPLGWHLDLGLNSRRLKELAPTLSALDIPLVIDHLGFCPINRGVEDSEFAAILELVRQDRCWIKLSGGYRLLSPESRYDDIAPYVQALCDAAPTRTIWGSDWPNVAIFEHWQLPETGAQLDALRKHIGNEKQFHAVLVDNPLKLFGLPGTTVIAA